MVVVKKGIEGRDAGIRFVSVRYAVLRWEERLCRAERSEGAMVKVINAVMRSGCRMNAVNMLDAGVS